VVILCNEKKIEANQKMVAGLFVNEAFASRFPARNILKKMLIQ
jgi:hypothetical protein